MTCTTLMAGLTGEIPTPGDPAEFGKGIQRTMSLLATSTPQARHRVKILVYGQSISEQKWWSMLRDDLQKRFPHAEIDMQNRAIGGFSSQRLIHPLQHDVYPFYPDLVIFHVYGADGEYRKIIEGIRQHTAAEVLIQKDHVGAKWPDPQATPETDRGMWWDQHMNANVLPATAERFGCGLVDVRSGWVKYLKDNALEPKALLTDSVHLNDDGCALMAGLIAQYMVHRPALRFDETLVRTIAVTPAMWSGGTLEFAFEGNRVDLIAAAGAGEAEVWIDGQRPSEIAGTYAVERPAPRPWSAPVSLTRVDRDADLQRETFTLKITRVYDDKKDFDYEVSGSLTGADGAGSSDKPFRSNSGRALIEPAYFFWSDRSGALEAGREITWEVRHHGADRYAAPATIEAGRERSVTVAQGLTNATHTLTLKSSDGRPLPLTAIRIYRPPVK